jgi:hypothetical protein
MRSFDKRDAIAIPCVNPFSKSINNPDTRTLFHNVDDMVMTHNIGSVNECEFRLTSSGETWVMSKHTKVSASLRTGGGLVVGTGATGSFTTPLGQVVTVSDGIITNIF